LLLSTSYITGKVFRIGQYQQRLLATLLAAIAGVEMTMLDNGFDITPGSGMQQQLNITAQQ